MSTLLYLLKRWDTWAILVIIAVSIACAQAGVPKEFDWHGWFVLALIGVMFVVLMRDTVPADFAMLFVVGVLMAFQIISTKEGLAGFSSSAVLSVVILYVIAAGLTDTGALDAIMGKVLGKPGSLLSAQIRLMFPTAIFSAFLNNTPLVAILIPIIQQWAPKAKIPVSQLMMPLSFAAIFGGTTTLIGTSTNLVVAGKAEDTRGYKIGLFDLSGVGVPVAITGFIYVFIFSGKLLPNAKTLKKRQEKGLGLSPEEVTSNASSTAKVGNDFGGPHQPTSGPYDNFTVSALVNPSSDAINKTVAESKLRGTNGLYLTSVQRNNRLIQAVDPDFVINAFDLVHFTGLIDNFPKFCAQHDFTPITDDNSEEVIKNSAINAAEADNIYSLGGSSAVNDKGVEAVALVQTTDTSGVAQTQNKRLETFSDRLVRAIIRADGSLPGKTPREVDFRKRYNAAILSVYRAGNKVGPIGNLGQFLFHAGDELVLLTSEAFSFQVQQTEEDLKVTATSNAGSDVESGSGSVKVAEQLNKEYLISMKVSDSSQLLGTRTLAGQTIEKAGLRGLPGLFLIALEREVLNSEGSSTLVKHAVSSDEILEAGDVLWFVGERDGLSTLRRIPGLVSPINDQIAKLKIKPVQRRLVEVVVSQHSDMVGKTVREARFRSRFRAAVLAVHRKGHRVLQSIGDIEIQAGDVLVLDTGPYFIQRYKADPNFLLVSEIENSNTPQFSKFYVAFATLLLMMGIYTGYDNTDFDISLPTCGILGAAILLSTNILTPARARSSINWEVIVTVAAAFGLSTALENTNVAKTFGQGLLNLAEITNSGDAGVLLAVYLATFLLSIIIANNAAALLMFPIAINAIDPNNTALFEKVLFTLMLAASSSFSSPFGYQTNLMVYGPGGYVFNDFIKFGLPLQFWQMIASVTIVYYSEYWYVSWIVVFVALFVVLIVLFFFINQKKKKYAKQFDISNSGVVGLDAKTITEKNI